ncbi:hypothetical protein CALK_1863 [Chitinivibrio alkaliphilus ACht1]|uniref:Uncharacterized protein n=1 Tax=Chitinivibrio alkaliphilus ACht1 TaxID=1313304 RepID=U7D9Z0_9BACT|nr:hypothetical protein CALK_1863 [Chitinivibrio alkaliphilus ACht1]
MSHRGSTERENLTHERQAWELYLWGKIYSYLEKFSSLTQQREIYPPGHTPLLGEMTDGASLER